MRWLLEVGIFIAGIMAGLLLGGLVPARIVPIMWRRPVGAFLGVALAMIALSRPGDCNQPGAQLGSAGRAV